jgi:archaeosortase A (PGF-CTERM-specific)
MSTLATTLGDGLAVIVVAGFALAGVGARRGGPYRPALAAVWVAFAAFWLVQTPHFAFTQQSPIEGVAAAAGVPLSLSAAWLTYTDRRDLSTLALAIAAMGAWILFFEVAEPVRELLVETVTAHTQLLMSVLGQTAPSDYTLVSGAQFGHAPYESTFVFEDGGHTLTYTILIACTGVGSMSLFVGVIAAVRAPLRQKLGALGATLGIIYALNLLRNVFIALTFGQQRLHIAPNVVLDLFGATDPYRVSYLLADRVLAQSLSVVALLVVTVIVTRRLPEVVPLLEDVLFVATHRDIDLSALAP